MIHHNMPPRMQIVWEVLERAKDAGDAFVVAACRTCITNDRLGRKCPEAFRIVFAFAA